MRVARVRLGPTLPSGHSRPALHSSKANLPVPSPYAGVNTSSQTVRRALKKTVRPVAHVAAHSTAQQKSVDRQAILLQRYKAHQTTVTDIAVTTDTDHKEIVTSSLDKTVALWTLPASELDEPSKIQEKGRITPEGGPVFSLVQEPPSYDSARRQMFCGAASKSVLMWDLESKAMDKKVKLNAHTGWVRALATNRRWLFSSGCNKIAQWDLSRSVPRKFNELTLYTGDVSGLAYADGKLFSCGADGSIRSWTVGKKGELEPSASRDKAHKDRVSGIICKKGFLYSVSLDGSLKMWSAQNLELIESVKGAHNGGKVHCLTSGPDGKLYTGGEDNMIHRWQLGTLDPVGDGVLYGHHYPVRALASGTNEVLVSADSSGEVAVWKV